MDVAVVRVSGLCQVLRRDTEGEGDPDLLYLVGWLLHGEFPDEDRGKLVFELLWVCARHRLLASPVDPIKQALKALELSIVLDIC